MIVFIIIFTIEVLLNFNSFKFPSPFLVSMAYWCPPEKLIDMFELLNSKVNIRVSLIKANHRGITALHALCCNPHFTDPERNLDYFESGLKWLQGKGIGYLHL